MGVDRGLTLLCAGLWVVEGNAFDELGGAGGVGREGDA